MKIQRFLLNCPKIEQGEVYSLAEEESYHLIIVLRLKPGAIIQVFDGAGHEFEAIIDKIQSRKAWIKITRSIPALPGLNYSIIVSPALCKDKVWHVILEKAVELGVKKIIPVLTSRSIPLLKTHADKENKLHRWNSILTGAVRQCGRCDFPECAEPISFKKLIEQPDSRNDLKIVLHESTANTQLSQAIYDRHDYLNQGGLIHLCTGPEGGFNTEEIVLARNCGWQICRLGRFTLRAETAFIAALSVIHTALNEF